MKNFEEGERNEAIETIFENLNVDMEIFLSYINFINNEVIIDNYMFKNREEISKRLNKEKIKEIIILKLSKSKNLERLLMSYVDISKNNTIFYLDIASQLLGENDLEDFIEYLIEQNININKLIDVIDVEICIENINKLYMSIMKALMNKDIYLDDYILEKFVKNFGIEDVKEKFKELLLVKYKYKECIYLKIADLEIEKINSMMIDGYFDQDRIKYILNLLKKAEILAKNNYSDEYILRIYDKEIEVYSMSEDSADLRKAEEIRIKKNRLKRAFIERVDRKEISYDIENKKNNLGNNKSSNIIKILFIVSILIMIATIGLYFVNKNKEGNKVNSNINNEKQEEVVNKPDANIDTDKNKNVQEKTEEGINEPTVKKSLPTRNSEYGDYDSDTQTYFMQIENLLTEYYKNYEKAVSSADYSYVRDDLVDNGQLAKELRKSIPTYKHKSVYVKHFSIYNFEMNYDYDVATFNLDTVFIVDENRIQIETQKMTVNFNYHKSAWEIDNYTDWEIVYKQSYDPDKDYFDFTNYRDYF